MIEEKRPQLACGANRTAIRRRELLLTDREVVDVVELDLPASSPSTPITVIEAAIGLARRDR
jgi:hypothetical protein